jgi:predicted RNA-binding Zn-ribbon protein involved in translation (DUF1610 family)
MAGLMLRFIAGPQECITCGRTWVAVWEEGTGSLECPDCGSFDTAEIEITDFAAVPHNKEQGSWH